MANITFGHYAQDGNDFEGFSIHGGLVVPVTLTLGEEEDGREVEAIFFRTKEEAYEWAWIHCPEVCEDCEE